MTVGGASIEFKFSRVHFVVKHQNRPRFDFIHDVNVNCYQWPRVRSSCVGDSVASTCSMLIRLGKSQKLANLQQLTSLFLKVP